MRVLVACEYSGAVSGAFRALGHNAYSCDLLPADRLKDAPYHYIGDYRDAFHALDPHGQGWDILIGHPPCTHLCVAGNRWHAGTPERGAAVQFVLRMAHSFTMHARVGWAIENPVGVLSTAWRKPTQYVQPWQFGHGETKKTGLWLHGLPPLHPTDIVEGREQRVWRMPPSEDRWKLRSETYRGIAEAMADQWGDL